MDSQFNSLIQSYSSNYVQYKVTGNPSYQKSYMAAKQGLDSIVSQLQDEVEAEKAKIADFYKSGVEQKIVDLESKNKKLQRGLVTEKDDIEAAKIRSEHSATPASPAPVSSSQYIAIAVLVVAMTGLSLL